MQHDKETKERALALRRSGKTYAEILRVIPVSKSTLSLWLRTVGLSSEQRHHISEKKRLSALKGAHARKEARKSSSREIQATAQREVGTLSSREIFLIGTALYWAEGSKQKEHSPSTGVIFTNSDARMTALFLRWLAIIGVPKEAIHMELYIHTTAKDRLPAIVRFWSKALKCPINELEHIYWKQNSLSSKRRNVGDEYNGIVRIRVRKSTNLNRKISGWIDGMCT